jgi:hypothetical protein
MLMLLLCVVLVGGNVWAAEQLQPGAGSTQRRGLIGPTASGYYLSIQLTSPSLYFYTGGPPTPGSKSALKHPVSTLLMVQVQDAQGEPVNGVSVAFELEPRSQMAGKLLISNTKPVTQNGKVEVNVQLANKVGASAAGQLIARVENMTISTGLSIAAAPMRAQ